MTNPKKVTPEKIGQLNSIDTDLQSQVTNKLDKRSIDAKGDLLVGSADNAVTRLAAGTNEHRLVADSGETSGLKYVADTTNYAVAAKGDLLVGTAADTVTNLAVASTANWVLTVDSSTTSGLKWAAAAGGGKTWQQSASGSLNGSSNVTVSSLTGQEILVAWVDWSHNYGSSQTINWRVNSNSGSIYRVQNSDATSQQGYSFGSIAAADTSWSFLYIPAASTTAQTKMCVSNLYPWSVKESAAITSIYFYLNNGSFDAGNYYVWELK